MRIFKRVLSTVLSLCCMFSCIFGLTASASASELVDATVEMDETCTLDIYLYDWTNATKDGVWGADSYVSTGQYDSNVNQILGLTKRLGDTNNTYEMENGQSSYGYAISGVEFMYLKIADFMQFSESVSELEGSNISSRVETLYKLDKNTSSALLNVIGLANGKNSYEKANALHEGFWCYQSDVLINALRTALESNPTTVKNALESYVKNNGGTSMDPTDENGWTRATDLSVGLYLLVETEVPEMVISTTNPFFVSLPMTSINGGMAPDYDDVSTGGHDWNYNVTVYPKNESGVVTLEKTVSDAGADNFSHNTTASAGDSLNYQIISTLPNITSEATYISEYTFQDVLSYGLRYDENSSVKIEIFSDVNCTDLVTTWNEHDANAKFTVNRKINDDKSSTMTITMTDSGLAEINNANTSESNKNNNGTAPDGKSLYAGYSNYTMRITYDAVLNNDGSVICGDHGHCNEVVLTWRRSANNYYDTLIDDCHVYTYGINLTKTFSDGKDDQSLFDEVLFKVQNASDGYYLVASLNEDEGAWYVSGSTDQASAATAMHPVTWNHQKGRLVIKGLEADTYILTEIETANSYTLLKENIEVVISTTDTNNSCDIYDSEEGLGVIQNDPRFNFASNLDYNLSNIPQKQMAHNLLTASATVDKNDVTMLSYDIDSVFAEHLVSSNAFVPLTVVNTHGFDLPQTGQSGAKWMPILGGTLIAIAAVCMFVFIVSIRKEETEQS